MTILVVGTIRLPSNGLAAALPAMRAMIERSRAEGGCLAYSYAVDVLDAGLIHVVERWHDREALDRHFTSAHIADWRAAWLALGIVDRDLRLYVAEGGEPT